MIDTRVCSAKLPEFASDRLVDPVDLVSSPGLELTQPITSAEAAIAMIPLMLLAPSATRRPLATKGHRAKRVPVSVGVNKYPPGEDQVGKLGSQVGS